MNQSFFASTIFFFCYNRKFFCWIAEMFLFRDHRRRGMIFGDIVSPRLVARCSFCWNRHIILLELSCFLLQSTVELFSSEFVFAGTDLFFCWKLVLFLLQLTSMAGDGTTILLGNAVISKNSYAHGRSI